MEGYAAASDGRRVDWELESADGKTASFRLNGQPYDLSRGTLFLVKTSAGPTEVRQLGRDLSTIKPVDEGCDAFAEVDADVSDFIHAAEESQS
jgi:hypothetical protein